MKGEGSPPFSVHAQEGASGRRRHRRVSSGGSERPRAGSVGLHPPDLAGAFLRQDEEEGVRTGERGGGNGAAGGGKTSDSAGLDRNEGELRVAVERPRHGGDPAAVGREFPGKSL